MFSSKLYLLALAFVLIATSTIQAKKTKKAKSDKEVFNSSTMKWVNDLLLLLMGN